MDEQNLKSLYDFATSNKLDVGKWDDFKASMSDSVNRKSFFDFATSNKLDLGAYEDYEVNLVGLKKKEPTVSESLSPDGTLSLRDRSVNENLDYPSSPPLSQDAPNTAVPATTVAQGTPTPTAQAVPTQAKEGGVASYLPDKHPFDYRDNPMLPQYEMFEASKNGDFKKSDDIAMSMIEKNPADPYAYRMLYYNSKKQGKPDLELLQRAAAYNPNDMALLADMAFVAKNTKNLAAASQYALQIAQMVPPKSHDIPSLEYRDYAMGILSDVAVMSGNQEEARGFVKQREQIAEQIKEKTPTSNDWVLSQSINNSLLGMGIRAGLPEGSTNPEFDIFRNYQPTTADEMKAGLGSLLIDTWAFGVGASAGAAPARLGVAAYRNYAIKKYAQEMAKRGLSKEAINVGVSQVAKNVMTSGITGTIMAASGSAGALGYYDAGSDFLRQLAGGATIDDVDYGHVLKRFEHGSVLGAMIGPLGYGTNAARKAAQTYINRSTNLAGMGAKVAKFGADVGVGTAGFGAENALFVSGGALLDGKDLSEITTKDWVMSFGTLAGLKGVNKVKGWIKSEAFTEDKVNMGEFNVKFTPTEAEAIRRLGYDGQADPTDPNSVFRNPEPILADPTVPQTAKMKIMWAGYGVRPTEFPAMNAVSVTEKDGKWNVSTTNKEGAIVTSEDFATKEQASEAAVQLAQMLKDVKTNEAVSELTPEQKADVLEKLKLLRVEPETVEAALDKPPAERTPEDIQAVNVLKNTMADFPPPPQAEVVKVEPAQPKAVERDGVKTYDEVQAEIEAIETRLEQEGKNPFKMYDATKNKASDFPDGYEPMPRELSDLYNERFKIEERDRGIITQAILDKSGLSLDEAEPILRTIGISKSNSTNTFAETLEKWDVNVDSKIENLYNTILSKLYPDDNYVRFKFDLDKNMNALLASTDKLRPDVAAKVESIYNAIAQTIGKDKINLDELTGIKRLTHKSDGTGSDKVTTTNHPTNEKETKEGQELLSQPAEKATTPPRASKVEGEGVKVESPQENVNGVDKLFNNYVDDVKNRSNYTPEFNAEFNKRAAKLDKIIQAKEEIEQGRGNTGKNQKADARKLAELTVKYNTGVKDLMKFADDNAPKNKVSMPVEPTPVTPEQVKAKAAEAQNPNVPLKEQKKDFLGQIDDVIDIVLGDKKSSFEEFSKEMNEKMSKDEAADRITSYFQSNITPEKIQKLRDAGFKITTTNDGVEQVVFDIEGDGTFTLSLAGMTGNRAVVAKNFPTSQLPANRTSATGKDAISGPGKYSRLDSESEMVDNYYEAIRVGNDKLAEVFRKQLSEIGVKKIPPPKEQIKSDYYALKDFANNERKYVPVPGAKAVKLAYDGEYYIFKEGSNYHIHEARTGLSVIDGFKKAKNEKQAIELANEYLKGKEDKIKDAINKQIEKYGESPRYAKPDPPKEVAPPLTTATSVQATDKIISRLKDLKDTNRPLDNLQTMGYRSHELWNKVIDDIISIVESNRDTINRVAKAIDDFKKSDFYKGLTGKDKTDADNDIKGIQDSIGYPEKEAETPPAPEQKTKSQNVRSETNDEDTSLKRAVADNEKAKREGIDAVEHMVSQLQDTSVDSAMEAAKSSIDSGSKDAKAVAKEIIKTRKGTAEDEAILLYDRAKMRNREINLMNRIREADGKEKDALSDELLSLYDQMSENDLASAIIGREASTIFRLRQKYIDSEYSLYSMEREYSASKGVDELTPEEAQFVKDQYQALKAAEAKLREVESNLAIEQQKLRDQEMINAIRMEAGKNKSYKPEYKNVKKRFNNIADVIEKGLISDDIMLSTIPFAKEAWNLGIKAAAGTVRIAGDVAQAVVDGLVKIRDTNAYKDLSDENKAKLEKKFSDHVKSVFYQTDRSFKAESKPKEKKAKAKQADDTETTDGKIKIPTKLLKQLVEDGVDNIDDLVAGVKNEMWAELEGFTDREIRDAITNYGKIITMSKEQVDVQLRKIKRMGKLASGMEDVQGGSRPLRSGLQRDKPDVEERAKRKELNDLLKKLPMDDADLERYQKSALDAIKTRLRNRIEELQHEIDTGEKKVKKERNIQLDAEAEELVRQRDELKKLHDEVFGSTELTDAQRIERALNGIDRAQKAVDKKIAENDLERKKSTVIDSPELTAAREALKARKEVLEAMREEAGILKREYNERLLKAIQSRQAKLQKKLDDGDFTSKQRTPKYERTQEVDDATAEYKKLQLKWKFEQQKQLLANRPKFEKFIDKSIKIWTGIGLLSGIKTLAKLAHYTGMEVFLGEPIDILTSGAAKLFLPGLARKAFTEGQVDWASRKEFYKTLVAKQTYKEAWKYAKERDSYIDNLYGDITKRMPEEFALNFGKLHGVEKYPLRKADFAKNFIRIENYYLREGYDVTTPAMRKIIGAMAYDKANYRIMMSRNFLSSTLRSAQTAMLHSKKTPTLGKIGYYMSKVMFPIISVPTNYTIRTARAWGGLAEFTARVIKDGYGKMTPEQAESALLAFKNGLPGLAIGIMVLSTGLIDIDDEGKLTVGGWVVPKYLTHHPYILVAQLYAEAKHAYHKAMDKNPDDKTDAMYKALATVPTKTLQETPYLNTRTIGLLDSPDKLKYYMQNLVVSFTQPQFLKDVASMTDDDVKRKPETFTDRWKMGVPGLRQDVPIDPKKKKKPSFHDYTK